MTFLGFVIDTRAFQISLPDDKLDRLQETIALWQGRRGCTRRGLESLLGRLSHAAFAIRPGRLFLRQLFALLPCAPQPYHHIRFNLAIQADLSWWVFLLREWNGVSLFPAGPPLFMCFRMPLDLMAAGHSFQTLLTSTYSGLHIGLMLIYPSRNWHH